MKAGTSSRRERLEGPSCRLGGTVPFPHWGPAGEAETGLKIRLVHPFLALRQRYLWHRAGVALRGTTRFPSASPRIREPLEALPLCRGLRDIPGGLTALWQSEAGVRLQQHEGCQGARGRQADAASIFSSSFILVSVWVAHVNRKVMGKALCENSLSFQTPKFKLAISVRLQGSPVPTIFQRAVTAAGFTPSFSKRIFPP